MTHCRRRIFDSDELEIYLTYVCQRTNTKEFCGYAYSPLIGIARC